LGLLGNQVLPPPFVMVTKDDRYGASPFIVTIFRGMSAKRPVLSREAVIVNELGLHARAAGLIARIAGQAVDTVWLSRDENAADAASIIDMLTLECAKGTRVKITAADPVDAELVDRIVRLINSGFQD
jgi:phosphocarrier protein